MSIKEALKKYHAIEIELILSYILGKSKEFLYMNLDRRLSKAQQHSLTQMVKRRLKGEPMAYILGYKDFYGLRFKVNRNVLIPRPETEWFIGVILNAVKNLKKRDPSAFDKLRPQDDASIRILDVGTGSGCIAISLAKKFSIFNSQFSITASDISAAALKVAKENAKKHSAKVRFVKSDLFKNIKGKFSIIIGNLPYVPKQVYKSRIKNLKWEPKIALVDPKKDFALYEVFLKQVGDHLTPNGIIYLELDPKTKPWVEKWAKKYLPSSTLQFHRDFNNFWRYAEIHII